MLGSIRRLIEDEELVFNMSRATLYRIYNVHTLPCCAHNVNTESAINVGAALALAVAVAVADQGALELGECPSVIARAQSNDDQERKPFTSNALPVYTG